MSTPAGHMSKSKEMGEEEKTFSAAYNSVFSHVLGMVIKAAIELGVFDAMANAGPAAEMTAAEITGKLPGIANEKGATMLDLMLEFLASHSILSCSSSTSNGYHRAWKRYKLTPVGRLMANGEQGLSFAPLFLFNFHSDILHSWLRLKEAVQEGVDPFRRAHGVPFYEHMKTNPGFSKIFNDSMDSQSNLNTEGIISKYFDGFMQISELIDVGGGTGATLGSIVSKFPHIKGINFDLPHVISHCPTVPGVDHVGGDMFDAIPTGENILLKWVLHNWDDEHCLVILKNCRRALPPSGKVIVVESILQESSEPGHAASNSYALSVIMMVLLDGAKERTEEEYRSLAAEASFSEFRVSCKSLNYYIMELVK